MPKEIVATATEKPKNMKIVQKATVTSPIGLEGMENEGPSNLNVPVRPHGSFPTRFNTPQKKTSRVYSKYIGKNLQLWIARNRWQRNPQYSWQGEEHQCTPMKRQPQLILEYLYLLSDIDRKHVRVRLRSYR